MTEEKSQLEQQNPAIHPEVDPLVHPKLWQSFGPNPTIEPDIPDDVVWIDDMFYVKETRFGLYTSIMKRPLGYHFITGMSEENVTLMTRWHLKCLQDGTMHLYTRVVNCSTGVKL